LTYPKGVIEDVVVKVSDLTFPVDFLVLDMEDEKDGVSLILGRPFLATGRALIDVFKGELRLRANDKEIVFSFNKEMQWPTYQQQCKSVDVVDTEHDENFTISDAEFENLSNDACIDYLEKLLSLGDARDEQRRKGVDEERRNPAADEIKYEEKRVEVVEGIDKASRSLTYPITNSIIMLDNVLVAGIMNDPYLKPPNLPSDFYIGVDNSNLLDPCFAKQGESSVEKGIDKDESRHSWERRKSKDSRSETKKGEVVGVKNKRGKRYWKVRMREDFPQI